MPPAGNAPLDLARSKSGSGARRRRPLADRLRELARQHPRHRRLTPRHMLKRERLVATRKGARRACSQLGLQVRSKRRRRPRRLPHPDGNVDPAERASGQAGCMSGQLVAISITGARLALFLDELGKAAAHPKAVVCDNGPELTSKAMRFWSERSGAALELHPARKAHPERLRGELQRQVPGQLPDPALVQGPRRRQAHRGRLAPPLQP